MFPTCSEVLEVIHSLGYVKLTSAQMTSVQATNPAAASAKPMLGDLQVTAEIETLVRLCGASEFFGEMIASRTALIHALVANPGMVQARAYLGELRAGVLDQQSFRAALKAVRRA